jgi:eukaryotic-like serine/threonine-protein kinase
MANEPFDEKAVFNSARGMASHEERMAYLQRACDQNPDALPRMLELLRVYDQEQSFLESPPVNFGGTVARPVPESAGATIGPYKLIEPIGEGGMGTVWMAQQTEPVKRLVAVKLIKAGMDSRHVIARFEAERQALALMDHPNIARVLDGGTTDAGRPYFVMDLVKGVPITRYCDEHRLTPRQRLELFIPVCQALQHAHQKGIIHRDIKPNNVLVAPYDGRPVVKVIDFGVAKAAGQQLTERTLVTGFGAIVGTLEYMSPEQAEVNQLDIDTRSDIYSLGVLMYELLAGSPPFSRKELEKGGILEMLRVIREQEPSKPSTKLSTAEGLPTLAANRGTEPAKLTKLVRGELDWIVMKALEKDRSRRYETANGFALDVQRYLADEPVLACPPSVGYRLRKFARRNKSGVAIAAILSLALVATVVVLAISNVWVRQERDQKEEALKSESTALAKAREQETLARANAAAAETQRQKANAQAQIAKAQEGKAKAQELLARRRFYAAQINLANQAWEAGNPARVLDLLETLRPGPEEEDIRTFEWDYLWRACHNGRRMVLHAHKGWANSLAFSPDSRTLVSSGQDGLVKLWHVASGKSETIFDSKGPDVPAVRYSPDGKTLAWVCHDRMVRIYDVEARKLRATLSGHTDSVGSLAFSPDGRKLVSGGQDKDVRLWDLDKMQTAAVLKGHEVPVMSVAFSSDGKTMASADWNWQVKVWDVMLRKERFTVRAGMYVNFLPNGKLACLVNTIRAVVDVNTGEMVRDSSGTGADKSAVPPGDTPILGLSTFDRNVTLWDVATGQRKAHHGRQTPIHSLAFSPDGKLVASGCDDGAIEIWDMLRPEASSEIREPGRINSLAFTPDSKILFDTSTGGGLNRWDTATTIKLAAPKIVARMTGRMALSPDGKTVASVVGEMIRITDLRTGQELAVLRGHTGPISDLNFSPDGGRLASCSSTVPSDGTARLWDLETFRPRATIQGLTPVKCVAFSPDGQTLVTGGQEQILQLWDGRTGVPKATLQGPQGHHLWMECIAFSPDGKTLAVGGRHCAVSLWDLSTARSRVALMGQAGTVACLAFSPDGLTIASGSSDGTVKLWDVITGQERLTLAGHRDSVTALLFSPDGLTLASGSTDGTIRLWRATAGNVKEAIAMCQTIVALSPNDASAHWRLGNALKATGDLDGALAAYRKAIELNEKGDPADTTSLYNAACYRALAAGAQAQAKSPDAARLAKEEADRAMVWLNKAVAAGFADLALLDKDAALDSLRGREDFRKLPEDLALVFKAHNYILRSQWDKAAAAYAKVDLLGRALRDDAFAYACLFLIRGDSKGYDTFCQAMIKRAGQTEDHSEAFALARTCAMASKSPVDPARVVYWAKQAVASSQKPWDYHVLALTQYRAGQFDQALQNFTKASGTGWSYRDLNWFGLALIHHRLGHPDEARQCLDKGIQWLERVGPPGPERPAKLRPRDWLEAQLLRREAEELLRIKRSP